MCCRKQFPAMRFDFLLFYYSITHLISDLKTCPAMPTDVINIYVKFHLNASTKYEDIASREIGVNKRTNGWTYGLPDGQPKYMMFSACYCWRMQNKPLRAAA